VRILSARNTIALLSFPKRDNLEEECQQIVMALFGKLGPLRHFSRCAERPLTLSELLYALVSGAEV
jgi:hypothetical protein